MGEQGAPVHTIAARPEKPHPVVAETKRRYRGLKPYEGWRKPTNSGLIEPPAGGTAHLHVAPASLDRALRLADALLKAAEARGHAVALDTAGEYAGIVVAGQFVGFRLREGTKRFPHVPTVAEERQRKRNPYALIPEWEYRPTGVLTFEIDHNRYNGTRRRWSEGERWKQEDRIDAVLDGIEAVAEALRAERLEAERRKQERLQREQERLRREEERRAEQERRDHLGREIAAWRFARDIRAYVAEMQQAIGDTSPEVHERLNWALRHADEIDPIAALERSSPASGMGEEC